MSSEGISYKSDSISFDDSSSSGQNNQTNNSKNSNNKGGYNNNNKSNNRNNRDNNNNYKNSNKYRRNNDNDARAIINSKNSRSKSCDKNMKNKKSSNSNNGQPLLQFSNDPGQPLKFTSDHLKMLNTSQPIAPKSILRQPSFSDMSSFKKDHAQSQGPSHGYTRTSTLRPPTHPPIYTKRDVDNNILKRYATNNASPEELIKEITMAIINDCNLARPLALTLSHIVHDEREKYGAGGSRVLPVLLKALQSFFNELGCYANLPIERWLAIVALLGGLIEKI